MIKKEYNISMIDMDIMHNVFGDNPVVIQEYLKNFIKVTFQLLKNTEAAIQKKDQQTALNYLHQLKSPVGSIGFKKMYDLCGKTEEKIIQSDWITAIELYHDIEELLKKLQDELERKSK